MVAQRGVDGDAGAEERGGVDGVERVGDGDGEAAVDADRRGEASVAADAGGLGFGAEMLFAGAAPLADAAGVCLPSDADPLAYGGAVDVRADGGYGADDLVAGNERVAADAPVVVDEVDVRVADAAVGDADLDFIGPELSGRVAKGEQLGSGGVGRESLDLWHGRQFSEDNPMTTLSRVSESLYQRDMCRSFHGGSHGRTAVSCFGAGNGMCDNRCAPLVGTIPHRSHPLIGGARCKRMGRWHPPAALRASGGRQMRVEIRGSVPGCTKREGLEARLKV